MLERASEKYSKRQNNGKLKYFCLFRCECGTLFEARFEAQKILKSCGCRPKNRTHGFHNTRTYRSWSSMLRRCQNVRAANYNDYGGRGITVCEEWQKFENFLADLGERPEGHTLDRINNELGYFKSNCRWATDEQQCLNRRSSRRIEIDGITMTVTEWSKMPGAMSRHQIFKRLDRKGLPPKIAVFGEK